MNTDITTVVLVSLNEHFEIDLSSKNYALLTSAVTTRSKMSDYLILKPNGIPFTMDDTVDIPTLLYVFHKEPVESLPVVEEPQLANVETEKMEDTEYCRKALKLIETVCKTDAPQRVLFCNTIVQRHELLIDALESYSKYVTQNVRNVKSKLDALGQQFQLSVQLLNSVHNISLLESTLRSTKVDPNLEASHKQSSHRSSLLDFVPQHEKLVSDFEEGKRDVYTLQNSFHHIQMEMAEQSQKQALKRKMAFQIDIKDTLIRGIESRFVDFKQKYTELIAVTKQRDLPRATIIRNMEPLIEELKKMEDDIAKYQRACRDADQMFFQQLLNLHDELLAIDIEVAENERLAAGVASKMDTVGKKLMNLSAASRLPDAYKNSLEEVVRRREFEDQLKKQIEKMNSELAELNEIESKKRHLYHATVLSGENGPILQEIINTIIPELKLTRETMQVSIIVPNALQNSALPPLNRDAVNDASWMFMGTTHLPDEIQSHQVSSILPEHGNVTPRATQPSYIEEIESDGEDFDDSLSLSSASEKDLVEVINHKDTLLAQSQLRVKELEQSLASASKSSDDGSNVISANQTLIDNLEQQAQEKDIQIITLQEQVALLHKQLSELQTTQAKVVIAAEEEATNLQNALDEAKHATEQMSADHAEQIQVLQETIHQTQARLEETVSSSERRVSELTKRLEEKEQRIVETLLVLESTEKEVATRVTITETLKLELEEVVAKIEKLKMELEQRDEEKRTLEEKRAEYEDKLSKLQLETETLRQAQHQLQSELESSSVFIESQAEKIVELTSRIHTLAEDNSLLSAQNSDLLIQSNEKDKIWQEERAELEIRSGELEKTLASREKQLLELQEQLQNQEQLLANTDQEAKNLTEECEQLKKQVAELSQQLTSQLEDTNKKVDELQHDLNLKKKSLEENMMFSKQLEDRVNNLQEDVASCEEEKKTLELRATSAIEEVKSMSLKNQEIVFEYESIIEKLSAENAQAIKVHRQEKEDWERQLGTRDTFEKEVQIMHLKDLTEMQQQQIEEMVMREDSFRKEVNDLKQELRESNGLRTQVDTLKNQLVEQETASNEKYKSFINHTANVLKSKEESIKKLQPLVDEQRQQNQILKEALQMICELTGGPEQVLQSLTNDLVTMKDLQPLIQMFDTRTLNADEVAHFVKENGIWRVKDFKQMYVLSTEYVEEVKKRLGDNYDKVNEISARVLFIDENEEATEHKNDYHLPLHTKFAAVHIFIDTLNVHNV
jgi:chromosome segregation ATPase